LCPSSGLAQILAVMRFLTWLASAVLAAAAFAKPPPDLQARLDQWNQGESGGIAVAWVDADGIVFAQSGRHGAGDDRPITPDTQFQIGSVTKVFTALLLAEANGWAG
jgi:serine-type D-Ala-D-Ala carboxypeptidase/endopeptidase